MKTFLLIILTCLVFSSCIDKIQDQLDKQKSENFPTVDFIPVPSTTINGLPIPSITANGVDSLRIRVIFPANPNRDLAKVNFTTSEGTFFDNGKSEFTSTRLLVDRKTNIWFIAATLKATTNMGKYPITIEVPEVMSITRFVDFKPSYPTAITTDKNKFAVAKTYKDEIQLIANLSSTQGVPHKGTNVIFTVIANSTRYSSDNLALKDLFRGPTTTDSAGKASVFFTPGDKINVGTVRYEVTAMGENQTQLSPESGTFTIVNP